MGNFSKYAGIFPAFVLPTHLAFLAESTINANSRLFASKEEVPASILQLHPDVVLVGDRAALSGLEG